MTYTQTAQRNIRILRIITVTVLCTALSFAVGIKTAGEFKAIGAIEANPVTVPGDFDTNGVLDPGDARIALEAERGMVTVTKDILAKDTNGDGVIDATDALWILSKISR